MRSNTRSEEKHGNVFKYVQCENRTRGARIPFFVTRDPAQRTFRFGFPCLGVRIYLHSTFLSVILLDLKDVQSFFKTANRCAAEFVEVADRSGKFRRDSNHVHHGSSSSSSSFISFAGNRSSANLRNATSGNVPSTNQRSATNCISRYSVGRERELTGFSRVFIDRRARTDTTRAGGPFARELRKAMQAPTTREPLVPSYVLTSISRCCFCLPSDSPFHLSLSLSLSLLLFLLLFSILLVPARSYLFSVSILISHFYRSLSFSPSPLKNFARFSALRSSSLFLELDHLFLFVSIHSRPFVHFFRFIPPVFSRYLPRLHSSCPCSLLFTLLSSTVVAPRLHLRPAFSLSSLSRPLSSTVTSPSI